MLLLLLIVKSHKEMEWGVWEAPGSVFSPRKRSRESVKRKRCFCVTRKNGEQLSMIFIFLSTIYQRLTSILPLAWKTLRDGGWNSRCHQTADSLRSYICNARFLVLCACLVIWELLFYTFICIIKSIFVPSASYTYNAKFLAWSKEYQPKVKWRMFLLTSAIVYWRENIIMKEGRMLSNMRTIIIHLFVL